MNPNAITILPRIARSVLAAIPADTTHEQGHTAVRDMQDLLRDPAKWVSDLGDDAAWWALTMAVEATAEFTGNGWEDDNSAQDLALAEEFHDAE